MSVAAAPGPSILIREATALDAQALASVQVLSWRAAYCGIIDDDYLAGLSIDRRRESNLAWFRRHDPSHFIRVAVDASARVVGFGMGGPARSDRLGTLGEVYVLYLLPDAQRRKIGTQLMRSLARGLELRGMDSLVVSALELNPARAFYARLGGRVDGARESTVGRRRLRELVYRWDALHSLTTALAA